MGCGASSAAQIAPINSTDVIAGGGIDTIDSIIEDKGRYPTVNSNSKRVNPVNINGYPPQTKPGFKFTLFQNKLQTISSANRQTVIASVISIAIQTENDLNGIKSQLSQTDIQLSPEEELDLIMTESMTANGYDSSDEDLNRISRSPDPDNSSSDVNKSVLLQTEDSLFNRKHNLSKKSLQHSSTAQVTVDVGIQVRRQTHSSATQTRFGFVKTSKTKLVPKVFNKTTIQKSLRKSMSVDIDSFRLWTAPTKQLLHHNSKDIDGLNIIPLTDSLNNNILQDIESQTDPKLSTVLAANSAGNDLSSALQSYDITSPFAHIERELLQTKNNFLKVPDNRLQDCLNKLLDDMDDGYKFRANSSQY